MNNESTSTEYDLFDRAFDQAIEGVAEAAPESEAANSVPTESEGSTPPAESATPGNEEDPSTETGDDASNTGDDSETSKPGGDAITDDVVTQSHGDYQRQTVELLEKLVKKGTSPGDSSAASDANSPDTSQAPAGGTDPEPFKLSDEQTALLKTFDDEWPEVAKASALRTEIAMRTAIGSLVKQLRTELAPMITHYQRTSADTHMGAIRGAHEDFDTLKTKVLEWIDTQPPGLRNAYNAVAKTGTAEDVIGLVKIYKTANGLSMTPKELSADASVTTPPTPRAEVQKAAASLAVVPGKRTVVSKGKADESDFDGAWQEAMGS